MSKLQVLQLVDRKYQTTFDFIDKSVLVSQLCLTLCDPMDCSPPGSSVHGIPQARKLEWVAMPFSWDLFDPRIEPMSPMSPALQADPYLWSQQGRPYICIYVYVYINVYIFIYTCI